MAKYCIRCGAQISDNAAFCDKCGAPVTTTQTFDDVPVAPQIGFDTQEQPINGTQMPVQQIPAQQVPVGVNDGNATVDVFSAMTTSNIPVVNNEDVQTVNNSLETTPEWKHFQKIMLLVLIMLFAFSCLVIGCMFIYDHINKSEYVPKLYTLEKMDDSKKDTYLDAYGDYSDSEFEEFTEIIKKRLDILLNPTLSSRQPK